MSGVQATREMLLDLKKAQLDQLAAYRKQKFIEPELRHLFLELTLQCNARCFHCGSSCDPNAPQGLAPEQYLAVLEDVKENFDISRMMLLVTGIAKDWGIDTTQLPVVGCAPEWMSEKAVSIANYVVATGIDTYLGIDPLVGGSPKMMELITQGTKKMVGAGYVINTDPDALVQSIIDGIEAKRAALGI